MYISGMHSVLRHQLRHGRRHHHHIIIIIIIITSTMPPTLRETT
jgi:hypothetical protein